MLPPVRDLRESNAHFQRAVRHLPPGVAATFRFRGEARSIWFWSKRRRRNDL